MTLDNYVPSMDGVPAYLVNLAKRVTWESEQECFQTFCRETARFYAVPPGGDKLNEELASVIRIGISVLLKLFEVILKALALIHH